MIVRYSILLVLTAICAIAFAQGPNLLTNADFEQGNEQPGPPPGWLMVVGQSPSVISRDEVAPHGGKAALRVQLGGDNNTGWVAQWVEATHPDTEYRLSGWVRIAPETKIPLNLQVEPNLGGMTLPAAETWTPWEWTFNSREASRMQVQFRLRGQGTVWLDDLRLEQTGATGASVLPDRAELLKLLEYQSHVADPKANTDDWIKPFRATRSAASAFPDAMAALPADALPKWKVGQWARYVCHDELIVPSQTPEKRPHVMLIDSAIVGSETVEGRPYYWLQSVVRLQRYWVAKAQGKYDSGEKILLDRPRRAVLTALVEGPRCADVRRYQLQVDDEPPLEYLAGDRAALPSLDVGYAWVRPFVGGKAIEGQFHAKVPVTGLVSGQMLGPHLERRMELVNWGESGAKDARAGGTPAVPVTTLRLPQPPYISVAFDGFGTAQQACEIVAAGAGFFENIPTLYLGPDRATYNQLPAYFYDARCWDADLFDPCRANFAGFQAHLDEPYQRQRKPNEYIKRGEVNTLAEAADRYTAALSGLLKAGRFWPGHEMHSYNSPTPAAWYDLRAGANGFMLENARLVDEMATIKRVTGAENPRELADEINIAFMAGATRRFGKRGHRAWWGQGLYRWTPEQYWRDELVYYASHGAQIVGFWIETKPAPDPPTAFYEQVLKALPELKQAVAEAPRVERKPTVAIVVPYGVVIGISGASADKPWGVIDYPEGTALTERLIKEAARLHDAGETFDVVVDDPVFAPRLEEYEQVIRLP